MATKTTEAITMPQYEDITVNDVIEWCKTNNQVEWLKACAAEKVIHKRYPRILVINDKGKKVSMADRSQKPKNVETSKSFLQIKKEFCEKFMPEIIPQPKEAPTMYDIIAAL